MAKKSSNGKAADPKPSVQTPVTVALAIVDRIQTQILNNASKSELKESFDDLTAAIKAYDPAKVASAAKEEPEPPVDQTVTGNASTEA